MDETNSNAAQPGNLQAADGSPGASTLIATQPQGGVSFWDGFSNAFSDLLTNTENALVNSGNQYINQTLGPTTTPPPPGSQATTGKISTGVLLLVVGIAAAFYFSKKS